MRLIRLFFLFYIVLFTITLPFETHLFENPAFFFESFFLKIEHALFIGIVPNLNFQNHFNSDSPDLFLHLIFLAILSILLALFFQKSSLLKNISIHYYLTLISSYILAFFLIKYGFEKVYKLQFYAPEPNILSSKFGSLDLDILYWSTVGKSYSYNVFIGLSEILPGVLLLFSRTRKLAAFIAFGILIHVLAINVSYQIDVKILSSFLLLLSLLILQNYAKELYYFFILNSNYEKKQDNIPIKSKGEKLLKIFVILFILFESNYLVFSLGYFNGDLIPKQKIHGEFELLNQKLKLNVNNINNYQEFKSVIIHKDYYVIFQNTQGEMKSFKYLGHANSTHIYLPELQLEIDFSKKTGKKYVLRFIDQQKTSTMIAIKVQN